MNLQSGVRRLTKITTRQVHFNLTWFWGLAAVSAMELAITSAGKSVLILHSFKFSTTDITITIYVSLALAKLQC